MIILLGPRFALFAAAALFVACTGGPAATTPAATGTPTASQPTDAPPSLDPSQSDAGVIGRVTLSNDDAGDRDGTYTVIGVAGDGSDCSQTFDGTEFIAVAWFDEAPDGQIHRFGISVAATSVPVSGAVEDVEGSVSFDFVSATGFGTQYTAHPPDDGDVSIDITREGEVLRFDFEGVTDAGAEMTGTMLCGEAD